MQRYKILATFEKVLRFFCNFAVQMRYFVYLSYDGTRFHGWQIQPNGISVEGEIERCLSTILRTPIDIVGAGRTDAGVHASLMVAHFDLPETPAPNGLCKDGKLDCEQLAYKVNRMLPPDISIHKVEHVSDTLLSTRNDSSIVAEKQSAQYCD